MASSMFASSPSASLGFPKPSENVGKNVGNKSIYDQSLSEMLATTPIRNILVPKSLLVVQARENVATLLQKLRDSQLRCAVVYDTENLFIGFVDALDVATHVLNVTDWARDVTQESFKILDWQAQRFVIECSGTLINSSFGNPFQTITPDTLLRDAVSLMSTGIHRLAVVENGNLVNIMSQWDVLMLLLARVSFLGTSIEKTILDAGLIRSGVLTVPDNTDVVEVIKYLNDNQLSGAPLVDNTGKISGNFSATDLLNLTEVNFPLLTLSVREFFYRVNGFLKPPIVCKRSDTVEALLLKMACYGIHRVYVVDEYFVPIGVITLTDIMKFLLFVEPRVLPPIPTIQSH